MNKPTNHWNAPEYKTLLDYVNIVKNKFKWVVLIFLTVLVISTVYALTKTNIYTAEAILKLSPPTGNILESPFGAELGGNSADRFIANEIETMRNISIRKKVAQVIIDSFKVKAEKDYFSLILNKDYFNSKEAEIKPDRSIANILSTIVKIDQKKGLDFIQITSESPSPYEAALFVNSYADVYREFNLADNRKQVTRVKEFLETQKSDKYQELIEAENNYKLYQLRDGTIQLDEQASSLISTMTELESKINAASVEATITKETLDQLKAELKRKDKSVSQYLETKATEPYLINLQNQIAEIEAQKDFALLSNTESVNKKDLIKQFDNKLASLKNTLKQNTNEYQKSILTASPEEIKDLTKQIFEKEVQYNSLIASQRELQIYLKDYERRFEELPEASIDLARLERERMASEKLYLLLEEKYQEALINEESTEGNVLVLNYAEIPDAPSAPNRVRIILIGLLLGAALGVGFAIFTDQLDKSVKTPDEIENKDIELLGWIPQITDIDNNNELVVAKNSDTIATDAFKSLRTILRYSKIDGDARTILITSSAPSEGKTLVSVNLAGSFALAKNRTIIIDCDLRKPRIHSLFNEKRMPGFTDYLVAKASYEEIIRPTEIEGMSFITAGTIPPNPTEILDSKGMKSFLERLRREYDTVVIDSPPLTTLADSLILSNLVDETILVARAYSTEMDLLIKSVTSLKKLEHSTFIGVLFNGFNLRKNYGSYYYKYAYSYNGNGKSNGKKPKIKKPKSELKT